MKVGTEVIKAIYIGKQFPDREYFLRGCMVRDDFSTTKEVYLLRFDGEEEWRENIPAEDWIQDTEVKVLTLVLKGQWYDLMVTGEKTMEFREPTKWIKSRLIDKLGNPRKYKFVKFVRTYERNAPYFLCLYEGFGRGYNNTYTFKSSPGLEIKVNPEDFVLFLGKVVYKYEPLKIEL